MIYKIRKQISKLASGDLSALNNHLAHIFNICVFTLQLIYAFPLLIILRLISPIYLVRFEELLSTRIGHLAGNVELYLCERDHGLNRPKQKYLDLFYIESGPICNSYLLKKWREHIRVVPRWLAMPIDKLNRRLFSDHIHIVGRNSQNDRDVNNLLDIYKPYLKFSHEEEKHGLNLLEAIGIPKDSKFVCLIVRDSAYLKSHIKNHDFSYHDFRDSSIANYVLAAEELVRRGYYVVRMGVKVLEKLPMNSPKVIDYAWDGLRTEFLDIYLGSKCAFTISVSTGYDLVPLIFRRPIAFVNVVPVAYLMTYRKELIGIIKNHYSMALKRNLSLEEIFSLGVGFSLRKNEFLNQSIELIENSPEEIRDLVVEMDDRINNVCITTAEDQDLQREFWCIYKKYINQKHEGKPLHGDLKSGFGLQFLRNNKSFLKKY